MTTIHNKKAANPMEPLPIDGLLPELLTALEKNNNVVLSADPGAGKTTRVPVALLDASWLTGKKIVMLEPRRLAAQRAAAYMAQQSGEKIGETIGYRIRGDNIVGKNTRVEVVTEGILTRFLQNDSSLPDVGIVIFDEYHERSIHADLGLALTLDVQRHLRPDLRILIMSATLDGLAVSALLGDAVVVKSEGRVFPVETNYLAHPHDGAIEPLVVSAIRRALRENEGDLLVFLPGQREIRKVGSLLEEKESPENVVVHTLFGDASPERQRAALMPAQKGFRKVILSTSIAETSLTIDGVRVVIDSGLARGPRFDPRRGMSGLVTTSVSHATAEQRRGRAGRQSPGVCYRMWTEQQHNQFPRFPQPEILVTDLAPLALEFARWGTPNGEGLRFIDEPPAAHFAQARDLLARLGALDGEGKLTRHGRAMSEMPVHPRLAHMLLRGKELGIGSLACEVAALLDDRDILRGGKDADVDLHSRLYVLRKGNGRDQGARERVREQVRKLRDLLGSRTVTSSEDRAGVLLALAYPERVARKREAKGNAYQLAGGTGAVLPKDSMLSREEYLAVGEVDGVGSEVKIFLAASLTEEDIMEAFAGQLTSMDEIFWDARREAVVSRKVTRFGAIELSHVQITPPDEVVIPVVLEAIRLSGLDSLPWTKDALSVKVRSEWLRTTGIVNPDWPDLSDARLLNTMEEWLSPYLHGILKRSQFSRLDLSKIIRSFFSYKQLAELDKLAPTHLTVPTGSRISIEYSASDQPVLAVRMQEMFGQTETPAIANEKVKIVLHLLSPAHRPLAVTQDLVSFWKNAYPDVRKEMRGRYPKHYWPEDPRQAEPTKRTKR